MGVRVMRRGSGARYWEAASWTRGWDYGVSARLTARTHECVCCWCVCWCAVALRALSCSLCTAKPCHPHYTVLLHLWRNGSGRTTSTCGLLRERILLTARQRAASKGTSYRGAFPPLTSNDAGFEAAFFF